MTVETSSQPPRILDASPEEIERIALAQGRPAFRRLDSVTRLDLEIGAGGRALMLKPVIYLGTNLEPLARQVALEHELRVVEEAGKLVAGLGEGKPEEVQAEWRRLSAALAGRFDGAVEQARLDGRLRARGGPGIQASPPAPPLPHRVRGLRG